MKPLDEAMRRAGDAAYKASHDYYDERMAAGVDRWTPAETAAQRLASSKAFLASLAADGWTLTYADRAALLAEVERLRAALQDIARQPEGDEESAQAVARAVLAGRGG